MSPERAKERSDMKREKVKTAVEKLRGPYRTAVCGTAMCLLFTSAALRAAAFITPKSLEGAALAPVISRKSESVAAAPSLAASVEGESAIRGIYEEEILRLDGETRDPPAETSAEKPEDQPEAIEDGGSQNETNGYPITPLDLSGQPEPGELILRNNETEYSPDLYALRDAAYPVPAGDLQPRVLIIHTHGTEAYSDGSGIYDDSTSFRSQDTGRNVVAVGTVIAEELEARGVGCVHCETMHDIGDFYGSYDRAKESILYYLDKYPSIQYILDVHRDAIVRGENEMIAPTVDTPEGRAAQVMLVMGTNAFGADHPTWEQNLSVACKLQTEMNAEYNLARPINLRGASFNEQFRSGSMLVEVGSSGNTLDQAKLAGRLFARALASTMEKFEGR